ncbi:hypothetical protein TNCV_5015671 [Trichonephila clavipes]|nr:hypothetical protein TNCV_5015671 [Trichonephila clavipes]
MSICDPYLKEVETDQAIEEPTEIMHIIQDSESKYQKIVSGETTTAGMNSVEAQTAVMNSVEAQTAVVNSVEAQGEVSVVPS